MHLKVLTIVLWFILKQNDINNDQFNRILTIFHYKKKKETTCITSLDQAQFRLIPHLWTTILPPPPSSNINSFEFLWILGFFFSTENNRIQSYLLLLPFSDYSGAIDLCAIFSCFV